MAGGFGRFGQRFRQEAAKEMRASSSRVHEHGAALTPVRTGRMRSLLREQPTNGGLGYVVGWVSEDFREHAQPFYAPHVVFGTRFMQGRDPLSPALEAERPILRQGLVDAAFRAARG